jgi:hypothetical protein
MHRVFSCADDAGKASLSRSVGENSPLVPIKSTLFV